MKAHAPDDPRFPSGGGFDFDETLASLPSEESDAIVLGKVSTFQPYLTAGGSSIYSELTTSLEKVIKDTQGRIKDRNTVEILQRGGTLKLGDGKVLNAVPYGGANPIQIGTRYLLFLRYHKDANAYTVLRAWDLSGDKPQELDGNGRPFTSQTGRVGASFHSESDLIGYLRSH